MRQSVDLEIRDLAPVGDESAVPIDGTAPELELLFCSACLNPDATIQQRIRELVSGGIDWAAFRALANRHRLTPLVYQQFSRIVPEVLNLPGAKTIAIEARAIAIRNLYLTQELTSILATFDSAGISAIPIKGPVLAVLAFGDLSWRQFGDLDILVRPPDLAQARALLEARGYRPERSWTPSEEAAYILSEHSFQYLRDWDGAVVELHWRLQDRYLSFPITVEELWNGASKSTLFGYPVLCISREHLVLFLCMHGAKHYWERLEWICCLAALIKLSPNLNWVALMEHARRLRGVRMVELALRLAHAVERGEATAAPLRLTPGDPIVQELAATVWSRMDADELSDTAREVFRFRFYLKARESLKDRLHVARFLSIRIPHPDSKLLARVPLPRRLWPLYYLLGPMRFFGKFGLSGLRCVLRSNPS